MNAVLATHQKALNRFTEEPNFRAYTYGLNLLFLNAVFFGPGH